MFYSYTVMGTSRLPLKIDGDEMKKCLDELIEQFGNSFSFHQLYDSFKYNAINNDWFKKEPYTQYFNIELTKEDARKISAHLWNLIWDKKLMIDFNHDKYQSNDFNDYMFSKV